MNRSWVGLHCHWSLITYTGRNMRLRGFGVHIFGHVVLFSLFYYYISFYYLIWFENEYFSFKLTVLVLNVEEESLSPMWLCLYLGTFFFFWNIFRYMLIWFDRCILFYFFSRNLVFTFTIWIELWKGIIFVING